LETYITRCSATTLHWFRQSCTYPGANMVGSWPEPQLTRPQTQPYEKPTREPTCEPNAVAIVKSVMQPGYAWQDPRWYHPHPCMPGVTSYSSALASPAHAAAGFLPLPVQPVEWRRPSWPVAPALVAGGPARGSVTRQHNSLNRKRTSSTNHLIGAPSHSNQWG